MAKIIVNNPRQVINGGAKKYYFKVKGLGGPKGDKGDKGDTGATGPEGPQGNAATVSIGSTTTLPVGYDATVQNVGTLYNAVLNFGIPQGPRGPQGATGATGAKGDKGDQGNPGPQGEKGTNATVYIGTTTTGEPGTQASVYNSGTSSNAVLNFTIPRGDVGPSVPLVQETGNSTTKAMSQNATTEALNGKQNTLTAGSNIQISGSTISATDTKYSAGNGITLTGTQFSANTSVLATKNDLGSYYTKTQIDSQMAAKQDDLVAGSNIQIAPDGKTISATDTTYTAGTGLTLTGTEFSADTTVLATQTDLTTALAPKLEAEVVTELPATGAEGKLYLTPKAHTTQTATGNPIEATVTEQAGQLESFQLDGDTFQQSYTGKNLIAVTRTEPQTQNGVTCTWDGASFTLNGTSTAGTDFYGRGWWGATYNPIALPAGTYTMSLRKSDGSLATDADFSVDCYYGTNHIIGIYRGNSGTGFSTVTFDSDTQYSVFYISLGSGKTYNNEKFYVQLEKSDSPTTYEPYVGGQPIPNPDYPQQIQTVTGTQTISINGTNYPINLGSLELCKLGTYQDYIYKDGDSWKVHKATETKALNGSDSEDWTALPYGGYTYELQTALPAPNSPSKLLVLSGYFFGIPYDNRTQNIPNSIYLSDTGRKINIRNTAWTTVEQFKTWLASNNTTVYYALDTPTDTTITDTTLIAQLETIRTAILENGTNTITNTATGSNLAGDMEIGYYGFNPRNRYDKWLWLDINNNYEQIGS